MKKREYIVMEYCSGGDLRTYINQIKEKKKYIEEKEFSTIMRNRYFDICSKEALTNLINLNIYYKFKEFDIEIKLGNFNIKDFPIFIETPKQKDIIETNIKQNNVIKFLKHHNVPNFLINIFPIIKSKDKKIIYVPFYEDIIENKIKINLKLITLREHKDGKDVLVFYPF